MSEFFSLDTKKTRVYPEATGSDANGNKAILLKAESASQGRLAVSTSIPRTFAHLPLQIIDRASRTCCSNQSLGRAYTNQYMRARNMSMFTSARVRDYSTSPRVILSRGSFEAAAVNESKISSDAENKAIQRWEMLR
jgi:hypothetical protein